LARPKKTLTLRPSAAQAAGGTWTSRKIAIVGCYPASWELAPYKDDSWEIWGFSRRNMGKLPRCDKWFELHEQKHFLRYETEVRGYNDYLQNNKAVVLQGAFPAKELLERFGPYFFSEGQSAWLMAYAIAQNPTEIGLWGLECLDQYGPQRWCVQHFAQVARDLGISVTVPEGCTLLTPRKLYAFPPALAT
jgi:hypothetical protein